jgi:hypothetical protein
VAESVLTLDCALYLTVTGESVSTLSLTNEASAYVATPLGNALTLLQSATLTVTRNLTATSVLEISSGFAYTLATANVLRDYHPFVGSGAAGLPTPPPTTLTAPSGGITRTGANAKQSVTLDSTGPGAPTGGTFTLTWGGHTTGNIVFNASTTVLKAALVAMDDGYTAADWSVTGTAGAWVVEFTGALGGAPRTLLVGDGTLLTGGAGVVKTVTVATTVSGGPVFVIDGPFQLVYPPTGTVTDSVTLRAPDLGNKDRLNFNRINRETRGGTLIVFADPIWPKTQTLVLSFSALKQAEGQDLLSFLENHVGQEIGLMDWESRYWQGVVLKNDPLVEDSPDRFSIGFEFEGELAMS